MSGDRATMRVATGYAVAGVRGTFTSERRMRARRTPDGWRVTAVGGGRRGLPPWEVDDFRERRTEHFVCFAPTGVPVDELVTALEDGYDTMSELLPRGRLRRRYLVVVAARRGAGPSADRRDQRRRDARRPRRRERDTAGPGGPDGAGAVAASGGGLGAVRDARRPRGRRRRVVTHELTHAALTGLHVGPHAGVAERGRGAVRLARSAARAAGHRPRRALTAGRHRAAHGRGAGDGLRRQLGRRLRDRRPLRHPARCSSSTRRSTTRACAGGPGRGSSTARCAASSASRSD